MLCLRPGKWNRLNPLPGVGHNQNILQFIFNNDEPWQLLLISIVMLLVAGWEIHLRQEYRLKRRQSLWIGTVSLFISSFFLTWFSLQIIIMPEPWYTPQYAIPLLEEYIELGIMKIIPKSAAKVILPMACIHKKEKTRIVVDGKPINMYTPAMNFKPAKIEEVKYTMFPDSRVLSQDAWHAFFQLKCTPQQALNQCVEFWHPVYQRYITCSFVTVFFCGKLSCYWYVQLDKVINKFFKLKGLLLNDFYDDAIFYAQNHRLSAGVLGSFIKRIYYGCGRLLKESKTDLLYGAYTFKFCGFQWNRWLGQDYCHPRAEAEVRGPWD